MAEVLARETPRRRRDPEGTYEAIIAAARAMMAERGPETLTVSDVAFRAGVNLTTKSGITPLRAALDNGHGEIARILREHGAKEALDYVRKLDFEPSRRAFDACLSLFTSFGFFNDEENEKVIGNISKSLKKGGKLLLDLRNAQKGLAGEEDTETTVAVPSGRLHLRVRFDRTTKRARAEHELTRRDGIRISSAFDVRVYSEEELTEMLRRSGMRVMVVHGSLDGEPFTPGAERMVVISKRLQQVVPRSPAR